MGIDYNNLFVYASDITKGRRGVDVSLVQDDFYIIQDILRDTGKDVIDFYIETPGGSGEVNITSILNQLKHILSIK